MSEERFRCSGKRAELWEDEFPRHAIPEYYRAGPLWWEAALTAEQIKLIEDAGFTVNIEE